MNTIRRAEVGDAQSICDIYNQYIGEGIYANCHTENLTVEYWQAEIVNNDGILYVCEKEGEIIAFLQLKGFSLRPEYKSIKELSLYASTAVDLNSLAALYKNLLKHKKPNELYCALLFQKNRMLTIVRRIGFTERCILHEYAQKNNSLESMIILTN